MSKKQFILTAQLTIIAAFLGGAISPKSSRRNKPWRSGPIMLRKSSQRNSLPLWTKLANNVSLGFFDGAGEARAGLGVSPDGNPNFGLYSKADKGVVSLSVQDGERGLTLLDRDGRPRAGLVLNSDGEPGLAFLNKAGKLVWSAP